MATSNRATAIAKLQKSLKKHFQPVAPVAERTLLEDLLFACCLEDASYDAATECFARLQESYFDWNEVRVTTVRELSDVFRGLPSPDAAAARVKDTLQSVFESQYSFDLDHLKKQNLGKAVATLEKLKGATPFTVAYVTQTGLGGHSIPLGTGGLDLMYIVGVIDEKERQAGTVPGLERAIPKNNGQEFASLLHQLAAQLVASPFAPSLRTLLLEIAPDCKDRLPKRREKKKPAETVANDAEEKSKTTVRAKKSDTKKKDAKTPPEKKKKSVEKTSEARCQEVQTTACVSRKESQIVGCQEVSFEAAGTQKATVIWRCLGRISTALSASASSSYHWGTPNRRTDEQIRRTRANDSGNGGAYRLDLPSSRSMTLGHLCAMILLAVLSATTDCYAQRTFLLDDAPTPLVPARSRSEPQLERVRAAALVAQARILYQRGELPEAVRGYQRAFRLDPGSEVILRQIVPLALELGRIGEATRYAVLLADAAPKDATFSRQVAMLLTEQQEYQSALTLYERAAELLKDAKADGDTVLMRFEMARLCYLTEQYAKAADSLDIVRNAIDNPAEYDLQPAQRDALLARPELAYTLMAECYLEAGRPEPAAEMFRRAAEQQPQEWLELHLARVDFEAGRREDANSKLRDYFERRLRFAGSVPYEMFRELLAHDADAAPKNQRILDEFDKLLDHDPSNPLAEVLRRRSAESRRET